MEQRLEDAARAGDIDSLYSLMNEDEYLLDCVEKVPFKENPLHIAASAGQVHFAMEIMRLKPSFARKLNKNGYSPVHLAMQNEQTKLVLRFLDVDRELVRVQGREGKTPLHFAVECGMIDLLSEFLSVCPKSIQDLTIRKESALHVAVKSGKLEALKVILEWLEHVGMDGPILKWYDDEGNTILHVATSRKQIEVVNLLIAYRIDVNAINMAGMTALNISKQPNELGNPEIRDLLIQAGDFYGIMINRRDEMWKDEAVKQAAMKYAAEAGDTSMLYSLIGKDPYILECFDDIPCVETPLHIAARLGHLDFAMEIMRWKPSFTKMRNQQGLCPIHLATIKGQVETLKQLLNFDEGLVQFQGRGGKTSLHYAAENGDILLLDTLMSASPLSILDVTDQGETALHVAIKNSNLTAFCFLLSVLRTAYHEGSTKQEKKALNFRDRNGNTVLHLAVQMNNPQVVQLLLDSGVKVNVKNGEGSTALDVLGVNQTQGNTEIMEMLRKAGASSGSPVSTVATPVEDNWTSKISKKERVVTRMMRYKKDMSIHSQNLLLIVAVLMATVAYQAAVKPPKRDNDKKISCNMNISNNSSSANTTISCSMKSNDPTPISSFIGDPSVEIILFWLTNIFALLGSLLTILMLLPGKYIVSILHFPIHFFVFCYVATTGISGSWFWFLVTNLLLVISSFILSSVSTISRRIKQRRLID